MGNNIKLNVRVGDSLRAFVAPNVGGNGAYDNVREYGGDVIRRDKARAEDEALERLKVELTTAFAARESEYEPLDATTVIHRNA